MGTTSLVSRWRATPPAKLPQRFGRILVVHLGSVSEMVYAMPGLRALRAAHPKAQLHLWCKPHVAPLWEAEPFWERVYTVAPPSRERYDLQVDLVGSGRSFRRALLQAPAYLTRHTVLAEAGGAVHELELVRRTLAPVLAAYAVAVAPELLVSPAQVQEAFAVRMRFSLFAFAMMHPGGPEERRWPAERYARLADTLYERYGLTTLLLGSATEADLVKRIVEMAANPILGLPGYLSFPVIGALARSAAVCVGNASGPVHVAAAAGAPTVSVTAASGEAKRLELSGGHSRVLAAAAVQQVSFEAVLQAVGELVRLPQGQTA